MSAVSTTASNLVFVKRLDYPRRIHLRVMTGPSRISKFLPGLGVFIVLFCASEMLAQQPPSDADAVVVVSLEGKLEAAPAGTENWAAVAVNQKLRPGDRIRTGRNSRATLRSAAAG